MNAKPLVLLAWLIASLPAVSHAQLSLCQKTSPDAQNKCETAATKAGESSDGNALAAGMASKGQGESGMGGNNAQANGASGAGFTAAAGACAEQKERCAKDCDPSKEKDNKKKPDVQKLKQQCDEKIDSITKQLEAAAQTNKDAQKKSEETKKESQQGMQMPQMPEKKKDEADKTPESTGSTSTAIESTGSTAATLPNAIVPSGGTAGTDCASDEAYLAESCKDKLKAQCAADPNAGVCQAFTARFCGTSGASSSSGGTLSNGDQLKTGSGLSDDYCRGNNAKMFCNGSNVDQCASCRALRGLSPLASNQMSQDCSLDPAGLPTPTANAVVPQSSAGGFAGGSSGGGGGGASLGSASPTGKDDAKATPDDPNAKLASSMGSAAASGGGGGGGGGGSSGSDSGGGGSDLAHDYISAAYNVIGRNPAAARVAGGDGPWVNPKITDVAPLDAPPLMRIQSLVIKARCDADKALNCPPHH